MSAMQIPQFKDRTIMNVPKIQLTDSWKNVWSLLQRQHLGVIVRAHPCVSADEDSG